MIQVHPKLDKVAMKCHSCRVNLGPLGDPARLQKETSCERERGGEGSLEKNWKDHKLVSFLRVLLGALRGICE